MNEPSQIEELIRVNINCMLKSDYLFTGVINYSKENSKEYKLVFKKILKITDETSYDVILYDGILSQSVVEKIVKENNHKVLKSVLTFCRNQSDKSKSKKVYFFIFKNNIIKEQKDYDNLVVEMKRKNMPDNIYYSDLAMKLNNLNKSIVQFN
jgi:hypothetical protein